MSTTAPAVHSYQPFASYVSSPCKNGADVAVGASGGGAASSVAPMIMRPRGAICSTPAIPTTQSRSRDAMKTKPTTSCLVVTCAPPGRRVAIATSGCGRAVSLAAAVSLAHARPFLIYSVVHALLISYSCTCLHTAVHWKNVILALESVSNICLDNCFGRYVCTLS